MNRILIIPLFILVTSLSSPAVYGQRYASAIGIRLGSNDFSRTVGLTAQQRIFKQVTLEGIIQSDFNKNTTIHILGKKHHPIISKRFNYYYGGGFSSGWEESWLKHPETKQVLHTYGNATTGMDLIAGIEMTVASTVISLDYKPNINLAGRNEFYRGQVGISARMVLVKGREQDKRWRQKARAKKRANREPFGDKLKNTFNFNNK